MAIARNFVAESTPRCSSSATCSQSNQGLGITGRPSYQAVRGKLGEVLVRGLGGLWYDRPFRYRTVLELRGLHGRKSVISSGLEWHTYRSQGEQNGERRKDCEEMHSGSHVASMCLLSLAEADVTDCFSCSKTAHTVL